MNLDFAVIHQNDFEVSIIIAGHLNCTGSLVAGIGILLGVTSSH